MSIESNENVCSEENAKQGGYRPFGREIRAAVNHGTDEHLSRSQEQRWDYTSRNTACWEEKRKQAGE